MQTNSRPNVSFGAVALLSFPGLPAHVRQEQLLPGEMSAHGKVVKGENGCHIATSKDQDHFYGFVKGGADSFERNKPIVTQMLQEMGKETPFLTFDVPTHDVLVVTGEADREKVQEAIGRTSTAEVVQKLVELAEKNPLENLNGIKL